MGTVPKVNHHNHRSSPHLLFYWYSLGASIFSFCEVTVFLRCHFSTESQSMAAYTPPPSFLPAKVFPRAFLFGREGG